MEPATPCAVLVVDDDPTIRECLAELLASEGFEVQEARNGREALQLQRLATAPPAIVVLDLMMPVMNGWQFLDEQKRRPTVASIPVIVVTASDEPAAGADRVLHKPFDLDVLIAAIDELAPSHAVGGGARALSPHRHEHASR